MRIMIRRGRLTIFVFSAFIFLTVSLHYFLTNLSKKSVVTSAAHSKYENYILQELSELGPEYYKRKTKKSYFNYSLFESHFDGTHNIKHIWKLANDAVAESQLYKVDSNLGLIIHAIKNANIIKTDYYTKGTQFKLNLTLEGDQSIVFKPKWYELDRTFNGAVYSGRDRFQAEILSFYLSALLGKWMVPISVERTLSMDEIWIKATPLVQKTSVFRNGSLCLYGNCLYCIKSDPICPVNGKLQGAAIFNMNVHLKRLASPWKRVYKKDQLAKWETNDEYCHIVKRKYPKHLLLDMVDIAIFDFLLQNGDRHTYELLDGEIIWIDNGKGLGNPHTHHIDILAPLYQCCMYRQEFITRLKELSGGTLTDSLKRIPDLRSLITDSHFSALDDRLLLVFATVEYCRRKNKSSY